MLRVSCPKCKNVQNYDPQLRNENTSISTKTKRCVYCGHTFKVHSNQEKSRIVENK
jgi:DNA-directed RNA polymerase subunit M/transcription elongation factor TFIIS